MSEQVLTGEKQILLRRIRNESRQRRGLPVNTFLGDPELLELVKEHERGQAQFVVPAMSSARAEDIERLTLIDPLTELYNYKTFLKELKAELTRSKRYKHQMALCMIAIDDFDEIAARFGSLTGDAVLKVVSNVLRGAWRELDISAKYGDQQFCIVLPNTHVAGAALVSERIRQRIGNQAISHNWQNFSVTASIGVAGFPGHANEYDELIARSMEALGHAIARGGDRVCAI